MNLAPTSPQSLSDYNINSQLPNDYNQFLHFDFIIIIHLDMSSIDFVSTLAANSLLYRFSVDSC